MGPRAAMDGGGKSFPSPGFNPRTVQPVMSRYTDRAVVAHFVIRTETFFFLVNIKRVCVCVCIYK